ncbi:hypothetical protein HYQ46_004252 [Verticillium longisporum]|nr:hypothetical protein HYQ46_004252 [Verticillium longisporum]
MITAFVSFSGYLNHTRAAAVKPEKFLVTSYHAYRPPSTFQGPSAPIIQQSHFSLQDAHRHGGFSRRRSLGETLAFEPRHSVPIDDHRNSAVSAIRPPRSKMCPAFQSASVSTTGFVADIFPFLPFVSSRETFDQQMGSYIRTTYVQQKFAQNFGCGNIDLRNTNELYPRFTTSVICNAIVQNSIQACNLASDDAPPLCADTCAFYAQSEALITSDRNLCPNPSNDLISLIRADFTNCYIPPGSLSTANCVQGVANEPNNCGYGNNAPMLSSPLWSLP